MNINLHIEHLILDGLPVTPHHGRLVQAAVETELARLLTNGAISSDLTQGMAVPYLPVANISLNQNSNPTQLGQQIAQAIYTGIGKK